jgi:tetrahydromethanopterin S-methyltransferase subunit F
MSEKITAHDIYWGLGQLVAFTSGVAIGIKHGGSIGLAVGFLLCLLVDIRHSIDVAASQKESPHD